MVEGRKRKGRVRVKRGLEERRWVRRRREERSEREGEG